MNHTTVTTVLVFVLVFGLNPGPSYADGNEAPDQHLWSSNSGQCQAMIDDQETFVAMDDAYYACYNNGYLGCTDPVTGYNIWGDHEIYATDTNYLSLSDEWEYKQHTRCITSGIVGSTYTWKRPQCWDADELGENALGEGGTCPEKPESTRFAELTNRPCPPTKDGNPCDAENGNKIIRDVDFEGSGLNFYRTWNSSAPKNLSAMGSRWMHSYADFLDLDGAGTPIAIIRPDGSYETLNTTTGGVLIGAANNALRVHASGAEFIADYPNGEKRYYDSNGRLDRVEVKPGQFTQLAYNASDQLATVTGPFGHRLAFGYNANTGKILYLWWPDNKYITYSQGPLNGNYVLFSVNRPNNRIVDYKFEDTTYVDFITGIEDELNVRYATYSYDSATGKALSSEHAGGAGAVTLSYSANATTVTDGDGRVKTYNFITSPFAGRRLASVTRNGVTESRTYNNATADPTLQRLASKTDELGNVTNYGYDDHHRTTVTKVAGTSLAHMTTYEYLRSDSNKITKIKRPSEHSANDAETTITYNAQDLPLTITEAGYDSAGNAISHTTTFTYNANGQVLTMDGPRTGVSDVTTFDYYVCTTGGNCGQLKTITNALAHVTTFNSYDTNGRLTKETDPNGHINQYAYDNRGFMITHTKISPTGFSWYWSYQWNTAGLLTSAPAGPQMSILTYAYDDAHRLTQISDAAGNKLKYVYDSAGNVTEQSSEDPVGTVKRLLNYTYDSFARLDTINNAGAVTDILYDAIGNLDQSEDPLFNVTDHIYDALNRLTETVDADLNSTLMAYDVNNLPTSVTAPNGVVTSYVYDDLGNLESEVSTDRGTLTYTHDVVGNVLTVTDARSITATYTYDALNRVTSIVYPTTSKNVTFGYDSGTYNKGKLTSMTDESGSTTWNHYVPGPLSFQRMLVKTQVTNAQSLVTKYILNSLTDKPYSMVYPSGTTLTFTVANGLVTGLNFGGTSVLTGATYDPFGPVTGWTWGNSSTASFVYNQRGEITSHKLGSDTRTLAYDLASQLTSQSDAEYLLSYGYDDIGRVDDFTGTPQNGGTLVPGSQVFTYDENGNRESITENSTPYNYSVATTSNRLLSTAGPTAKTFTYDAAGNVTADGTHTYVYDDRGRMESINGGATTYDYNAVGERVEKTTGSTKTLFVYGLNGELQGEYDGAGNPIQETIWLDGRPVATKQSSTVYYVHSDHLGTPRVVADGNTIVWRWESDPFGSTAADEDPDGNSTLFTYNLRFPGQYYDSERGLHYNYFRTYDPSTGRYLESDPIGLNGGLNTYGYVGGNPVAFSDPTGEFRVRARKAYLGSDSAEEWRFWFEFTNSCLVEKLPTPSKWFNRLRKGVRALPDTYSGENDVPKSELCECRNLDPALEDFFNAKGYKAGGFAAGTTQFNRAQAERVLRDLRKEFEGLVDEGCESDDGCKSLRNAYPWADLLDNAQDRALPSVRDLRR